MEEDGVRLTSYVRERRHLEGGGALGEALIGLFDSRNVAASILLHGDQSEDAALAAIAVGARPDADVLLSQVAALARPCLVILEPVRLLRGDLEPARLDEGPGEVTELTAYFGRRDRVYQVPAFEAACELLYRRGIACASVLAGTDGTIRGRRQRAHLIRHDADVPLMLVAVGPGSRIAMVLPELGAMFRRPLMTMRTVQQCKRDGGFAGRPRFTSAPAALPGTTARLKLTVYTAEGTRHDGQFADRVIIRELRAAGISGAATVRGSWGFHADHAPHGDHFPHRGRHVPAMTTVIGTAEQVTAAFDVIDALTAEGWLVTAGTVLAADYGPLG
ncbi:MAG TPA: DUF190 domain-containing protein [Trebonia sp.]|nr:DUF190 domain-containing protein [Trebonia sp.]